MKQQYIKNIIFYSLMALLCGPMLFHSLDWSLGKKLRGWQAPVEEVQLRLENWRSGDWQHYQEAAIKAQLKARPWLIRFNNQVKYSLFGVLNARDVIAGKEGQFFEEQYIRAYLGLDVAEEQSLEENVEALEAISDSLFANGTAFMIVLASGKGTFMPENFPDRYASIAKSKNNYEVFLQALKQTTIPTLDLNQYLLELKDTASHTLYTKGNTHWSNYALGFVVDTFLQRIELLLNKDLPDYQFQPLEMAQEARGNDAGIFNSLNLLWTKLEEDYAYRPIKVLEEEGKYQPQVWVIGDSFYGTLFEEKIPHRFFDNDSRFLYYYQQLWAQDGQRYRVKDVQNLKKSVLENDLVLVFITDANIDDCCWGMTGAFYRLFHPE